MTTRFSIIDDEMCGAVISPCEAYRYRLWRHWCASAPWIVWVMLNPSTADTTVDDPTVRRVRGFTKAWGFGGFDVVNLFAYRATSPADMLGARARGVDILGPDRDKHLRAAFESADGVVCAWGSHSTATPPVMRAVMALVPAGMPVGCLGRTASGAPRHPLYLRADTAREPWAVRP